MKPQILGIHHITAVASDPQRNLDFYTGVLGLRLVKKTVNYDDPGTYHFYYGDEQGQPGTILTFFPWPGARQGRNGNGQVTTTSFAIPTNSVNYWLDRLKLNQVIVSGPTQRFEEEVWSFQDPDGLYLELVVSETADSRKAWKSGPVPPEFAIRGFYGATLSEEGYEKTGGLLSETLGFQLIRESGNRFRFHIGEGEASSWIDILCLPGTSRGQVGAGSVHHIAWRTDNETNQAAWLERLIQLGFNVSPVMNREYFRSIYFREPGGILFEVATDLPGFTVDEPVEALGTRLCLPEWLEPTRGQIEQILPPLLMTAVGDNSNYLKVANAEGDSRAANLDTSRNSQKSRL